MNCDIVIWDWNGTLLDDVDICVESMNELLGEYLLTPMSDREYYRTVFCFPVRNYYEKLGFDFGKVPFEKPALEFVEKYEQRENGALLREGAREALSAFSAAGLRQVILSASEKERLWRQISERGVNGFFGSGDILGIEDSFAAGKTELAKGWFAENGIARQRAVLIGDTLHDAQTADAVGCGCVLVSGGHQSEKVLTGSGKKVVPDLSEAVRYILS